MYEAEFGHFGRKLEALTEAITGGAGNSDKQPIGLYRPAWKLEKFMHDTGTHSRLAAAPVKPAIRYCAQNYHHLIVLFCPLYVVAPVRGPAHSVRRGKTPVLGTRGSASAATQYRPNTGFWIAGLGADRAHGVQLRHFARIGAAVKMRV
jgi:hypothetical protein